MESSTRNRFASAARFTRKGHCVDAGAGVEQGHQEGRVHQRTGAGSQATEEEAFEQVQCPLNTLIINQPQFQNMLR